MERRDKYFLCLSLGMMIAVCLGASSSSEEPAGIAWASIRWDGTDRMYGLHVPEAVEHPAPLVVLLHGGGGSASVVWGQEHGRSWRSLAETHGFVILVPEGVADVEDPDSHHWNDCRVAEEGTAIATSADDVGFILHAIEQVTSDVAIDANRIYVTGASNGGMMTYRLALETRDMFAAAAAVIANLPEPSECSTASSPIPMLIMNGTDDPLMPYDGGCVAGASCQRGRVLSTLDTVAFWVSGNGASTEPDIDGLPNRFWFDGSTVTVYRYDGGPEGADVVYYRVNGGGHSVPGYERIGAVLRRLIGGKNRDIDGPTEIWAFFQQHSLNEPPTSL